MGAMKPKKELTAEDFIQYGKDGAQLSWKGKDKTSLESLSRWGKASFVKKEKQESFTKAVAWLIQKFGTDKAYELLAFWGIDIHGGYDI